MCDVYMKFYYITQRNLTEVLRIKCADPSVYTSAYPWLSRLLITEVTACRIQCRNQALARNNKTSLSCFELMRCNISPQLSLGGYCRRLNLNLLWMLIVVNSITWGHVFTMLTTMNVLLCVISSCSTCFCMWVAHIVFCKHNTVRLRCTSKYR